MSEDVRINATILKLVVTVLVAVVIQTVALGTFLGGMRSDVTHNAREIAELKATANSQAAAQLELSRTINKRIDQTDARIARLEDQ